MQPRRSYTAPQIELLRTKLRAYFWAEKAIFGDDFSWSDLNVRVALYTGVTVRGDTLRQFMLREIFLHEMGHHVLQHYKGKRLARVARTRDHEAFANRFVEKHRGSIKSGVRPPIRRGESRSEGTVLP